jgi:hypothetical protein
MEPHLPLYKHFPDNGDGMESDPTFIDAAPVFYTPPPRFIQMMSSVLFAAHCDTHGENVSLMTDEEYEKKKQEFVTTNLSEKFIVIKD